MEQRGRGQWHDRGEFRGCVDGIYQRGAGQPGRLGREDDAGADELYEEFEGVCGGAGEVVDHGRWGVAAEHDE